MALNEKRRYIARQAMSGSASSPNRNLLVNFSMSRLRSTCRAALFASAVLGALLVGSSLATADKSTADDTGVRAAEMARTVTIFRDSYGVPHVYGTTDAACAFGFIYAQAEDYFWQIEDNYIRSLGRASELYGEKSLPDDLLNRALEIPRLSKEEF